MKPVIDRKRHILKTLTWRVIGTIDTVLIGWIIAGDLKIGLSVGGIELFTKMFLYYLHERAWYKIDFGVKRKDKKK
jgi:uncharacterized membrane protein